MSVLNRVTTRKEGVVFWNRRKEEGIYIFNVAGVLFVWAESYASLLEI
tara:strand:- start:34 stop:177 length:144 start_codon:yes stop_codon:yes gene_type:complete